METIKFVAMVISLVSILHVNINASIADIQDKQLLDIP